MYLTNKKSPSPGWEKGASSIIKTPTRMQGAQQEKFA
jgi:hypothetical protein